jgi:hypothetical protein
LLIAAIVSLAILIILLSILNIIPIGFGTEPAPEAGKLLGQANTNPATMKESQRVVFKPNMTINARGIALSSQSGLTEGQICLSTGSFPEESQFIESDNKKSITFRGTVQKDARIIAICDIGKELAKTIEENYSEAGILADWLGDCECANDEYEDTCCLVALRTPR